MCLSNGDIKKQNVCWNNVGLFRKIFRMNIWELVNQYSFIAVDLI